MPRSGNPPGATGLVDWLEIEVRNTGLEQMHSERHAGWIAPRCIVSRSAFDKTSRKSKATIFIEPAEGATYKFHNWKLNLDHELVLDRLIYDVYASPSIFIRELIQNALDATRCQMYADFSKMPGGSNPPASPTQFDRRLREEYPISVSLAMKDVQRFPDSRAERKLIFEIEDHGTGMNEHIITNYLLQVGRSYYQSAEFREQYKFAPTSRFGIGFLSVFAVSDDVEIETSQVDPKTGKASGLRMSLRGPRSFLLTETWDPFTNRSPERRHGTRIRVAINEWGNESLVNLVSRWCVATELPIHISDRGVENTIRSVNLVDNTVLSSSHLDPDGRFKLRVFDLKSHGCEGQIALIVYEDTDGEGWCDCWSRKVGLDGERIDNRPHASMSFSALHGVLVQENSPVNTWSYRNPWIQRVDVRSPHVTIPLAREASSPDAVIHPLKGPRSDTVAIAQRAVMQRAQQVISQHLQDSVRSKHSHGVYYINDVLSVAPVDNEWRDRFPGTILMWDNGRQKRISAVELLAAENLTLAAWSGIRTWSSDPWPAMRAHPQDARSRNIVSWGDVPQFASERLREKCFSMSLGKVSVERDLWLFEFSSSGSDSKTRIFDGRPWFPVAGLPSKSPFIHIKDFRSHSQAFALFLEEHPIVKWLRHLLAASSADTPLIELKTVYACWDTAANRTYEMRKLVERWKDSRDVPDHLKPPSNSFDFDDLQLVGRRTV
jgi:molecular chaperone HtpG